VPRTIGHLAEDLAGVALADDPLDPVGRLDRLDAPLHDREDRPLVPLLGGVFAGAEIDVGGRPGEPLAVGGGERREGCDLADLLRGDHGGSLPAGGAPGESLL
jgi:hypothetical protein